MVDDRQDVRPDDLDREMGDEAARRVRGTVIVDAAPSVSLRMSTTRITPHVPRSSLSTQERIPTDWLRVMVLVARYRDFPLGTVDASVVTCADRLGVVEVATLDHRQFAAVRPRHVDAFHLLP